MRNDRFENFNRQRDIAEMFAAGAGRIVSARYQQALVGPPKEFL